MLQYKLRQCTNSTIESSYQKWYAQAIITETLDIDSLAEHMAAHNTPFSKGAIKGILTDMVTCIKEEIIAGKAVKIDDLAIFKLGIVSKKGCDDKSSYKASEYIEGVRLRALATGELSTAVLTSDVSLKRSTLDKDDTGDVDLSAGDDDDATSGNGAAGSNGSTSDSNGSSNKDNEDGVEIV